MKKRRGIFIATLLLLSLVTLPLYAKGAKEAKGTVVAARFNSVTLRRSYEFNVYLPAGYEESGLRYPTVYLLHGRGDTKDAWLNVRDRLDTMIEDGEIPPVIAVMPDMPALSAAGYYIDSLYKGGEPLETAFFNDLIPYVDATYRTLAYPASRVVGGYSMGGYGAMRYALAHSEMFSGALILSPAVYTPLPPADSSAREFGAFGRGDIIFDEEIYRSHNYPVLLKTFKHGGQPLHIFIAVGDDEWKHPDPEDQFHDLDLEAHLLFNHLARVSDITAEFRVYNGGHDWDVWKHGFEEGMAYLAKFLKTSEEKEMVGMMLGGDLLGTSEMDVAGGVAFDSEGALINVLGAAGSIANQPYSGNLDVVVIKRNKDGQVLWTRQIGTNAADRPYGVAVDSANNIVVVGYTSGNLDGKHVTNKGNDPFVIKLASDGTVLWISQFGDGNAADRGYGLAVAQDGAIYVTGYTKGALNGANAGDKDVYCARLNPKGEVEWIQQFGGDGEDKGQAITATAEGVVVAGMTSSDLAGSKGDIDGFLVYFDTAGNKRWMRQFGTPGRDEVTGMAAGDKQLVITGFSSGDFAKTSAGDKDMIVAFFDYQGNLVKTTQIGTPLNDKGADITFDTADNVVVAGFTDGNLAGSIGKFDIVLIKYAPSGEQLGVWQLGTPENDGADEWAEENLFLAVGPGDCLVITGLTLGKLGTIEPFGGGDVFLTPFITK